MDGMKRRLHVTLSVYNKIDGTASSSKAWSFYANFTDDQTSYTFDRFFAYKQETIQKVKMNKLLSIGVYIEPQVYFDPEA